MTVVGSPGGRSTRDGSWRGLLFGLAVALALHALMLPSLGWLVSATASEPTEKGGAQLVRLSKAAWEQNRRITLDVKDAQAKEPDEVHKEKKPVDDDTRAPGQVVSLPPPEKEERPDTADYASEWNQKVAHETRSRDQRQHAPAITRRLMEGATGAAASSSSPRSGETALDTVAGGPTGPGRAERGDSGTDATDGAGQRMFALELPRQAAREPLKLRFDVDGILENRTARPELPGTGDSARIAMGPTAADAAHRPGSGSEGDRMGQGMRGGAGAPGLPGLDQLTPAPEALARLAGAPANDYLPEVEVDAETRLNAWRWRYATFFNRVADRIRREWEGGKVLAQSDPTGHVYGFESRMTVVQVTLDKAGNVLDVAVEEHSGALALDDEAVRAFKEAGPFANPPPQLFKGEDRFTFSFGFNVSYDRSHFDLRWRPD